MLIEEHTKEKYLISTDKSKLNISVIHDFLSSSYWAENIPIEIVKKSIENSLCFGVYINDKEVSLDGKQVGFARIISDFSTYAYLADVFILQEERRKGLSKWLMECILKHKELQQLRSIALMTKDAQGLYEKYGFKINPYPDRYMLKRIENIYKK